MKTNEYSNGEITVVWKADKCIHAGNCVRALPKVYDPKARPWITVENASTQELMDQINQCPSGALTYYKNGENQEAMEDAHCTQINVRKNGPLLVHGAIVVTNSDGHSEQRDQVTAFCRCGHSSNKPYCDGAHKEHKFEG